MNTERKTAIIIGALFFLSTTTYMVGDELIRAIVSSSDYLKSSYPNASKIGLGTILQLVNDFAVVGIGILFFTILAKDNQKLAFVYMSSRIIEGALLLVSQVSILSIIPLSEEYINASQTDLAYFETFGVLLKTASYNTFQLAMISLSIGSLFLCYVLYKQKLIPRIISLLGFMGYGLLLVKMISELLGYDFGGEALYIPGALFEMIMPLCLIVKGFRVPTHEKST